MWEKNETQVRELYPKSQEKPPKQENTGKEEHLLGIQILLCAVMAAFVLFSKSTGAPYWANAQDQYHAVVENGISFSSTTTFSHFADQVIEKLRRKAQDVLDQLDTGELTGQGGIWKISNLKKEVPEGATLETFNVEDSFQMPVSGVLTSGYGFRDNPIDGEDDFHAGLDIAAAMGTSVDCFQDGQVVRTG